ncbi:MAG: S41 family peptidase [Deltaproteobacteria bacterium]|nr:S41 family peptidase [Deltaproteobacteria bacterium]
MNLPVNAGNQESSPYEKLDIFATVLSVIEQNYAGAPKDKALIEGAITGMLKTLDPHSSFLTPDDFKMLREDTDGNFCGVGLEVVIKDNYLTVITPIDNSPAKKAGILAGDVILKIDGLSALSMDIEDAVHLMRGQEGTKVTVTLLRKGVDRPFDVILKRGVITLKSVDSKILADGIVYIKISTFTDDVSSQIKESLKSAGSGLKGVVIDLRGNPGGLMYEAVKSADLFISKGTILTTRGRDGKILEEFKAHSAGTFNNLAVVVLINGSSASASEILAGALKENGTAFIAGSRSFGKGSVQTIIPLKGGYGLKLTTALYYTPGGKSIQAKGIEPDIVLNEASSVDISGKTDKSREAEGYYESDLPGHFKTEGEEDKHPDIKEPQIRAAFFLVKALARKLFPDKK